MAWFISQFIRDFTIMYTGFIHFCVNIQQSSFERHVSSESEIDHLNTAITEIAIHASYQYIPVTTYNARLKPYWTRELRDAHKTARIFRREWIGPRGPRGMQHESYRMYKSAKRTFNKVQNEAYNNYLHSTADELNKAAECNLRLFWKMWNGRRTKKRSYCNEARVSDRTISTPKEITEEFVNYYKKISYSNDTRFDEAYGETSDSTENLILNGTFTFDEVITAIKSLKLGKAPGTDNLQNEHLEYGGQHDNKVLQ